MIYVCMTDKFMSGWGKATGLTAKYIVQCETMEQAELIAKNAKKREEMRSVNISLTKPYYNENQYQVTWKTFNDLSGPWKE